MNIRTPKLVIANGPAIEEMLHISQVDLKELLSEANLSVSTFYNYLNSTSSNPCKAQYSKIVALAEAFKCSVDCLILDQSRVPFWAEDQTTFWQLSFRIDLQYHARFHGLLDGEYRISRSAYTPYAEVSSALSQHQRLIQSPYFNRAFTLALCHPKLQQITFSITDLSESKDAGHLIKAEGLLQYLENGEPTVSPTIIGLHLTMKEIRKMNPKKASTNGKHRPL